MTLGLPRALAIMGTKGGEQMALTEVAMNVSLSTLVNRQNKACNKMLPMTVPNKKMATIGSKLRSSFRLAMEATVIQNI